VAFKPAPQDDGAYFAKPYRKVCRAFPLVCCWLAGVI
jgi:hypothetical protein